MNNKSKNKNNARPYMMCAIDGFDRVSDTVVLLTTQDYKTFMAYLKKAVDEDPSADIILDPDDGGDCYEPLKTFLNYRISAKPIQEETYKDIRSMYEKEHFGFNYVLDAVLETIFLVLEADLEPSEVKWFSLRSPTIELRIHEKEKNKQHVKKINKQAIYLAANDIKNCGAKICELVSKHTIDVESLQKYIYDTVRCAAELEDLVN